MSRRKHSPIHDFWHPRVEGQIRHTMNCHPEWFIFPPKTSAKRDCINSIAKRVVGEIVAATIRGDDKGLHDVGCGDPLIKGGDVCDMSSHRGAMVKGIVAPLSLVWYNAKNTHPEKGCSEPYLVRYKSNKGKFRTTIAIWAGEKIGWKCTHPAKRNIHTKNILFWAKLPKGPNSEML